MGRRYIPCLTLELVAIGLGVYNEEIDALEDFLDGDGRLEVFKSSRGLAGFWASTKREPEATGPYFGCLLLNWENRE